MKRFALIVLLLSLGIAAVAQKPAATPQKTRVLLVLDCSQSMWDKWQSDAKIKVTQQVLLHLIDSIHGQPDLEVALRVFGHLNDHDYATNLEVPFAKDNTYKLQSKIKTLVPHGGCTAATALNSSRNDFPKDEQSRNIIVVITDHIDDPDGDIVKVTRQIQSSGNVLRTWFIGIGDDKDFQNSGSLPIDIISSESSLFPVLMLTFNTASKTVKLPLELHDANNHLFETDVPVAFFDHDTRALKLATIYHYDTENGIDTLVVDPLINYDVVVYTKPELRFNSRRFTNGATTVLSAPQGSLAVQMDSKRTPFQVPAYTVLVHQHDSAAILAAQPLGTTVSYLNGLYDIDVLTTPVTHLSRVSVRCGTHTGLQIPQPGQLALSKPKVPTMGSVYLLKGGAMQWVCDLSPDTFDERLVLMPGTYQVVLRPIEAADYLSARTARFTITAAQQTAVNLEKTQH